MAAIGCSLVLELRFLTLGWTPAERNVSRGEAANVGWQRANPTCLRDLVAQDQRPAFIPSSVVGPYANGDAQGIGDNEIGQLRGNIHRESINAGDEVRALPSL